MGKVYQIKILYEVALLNKDQKINSHGYESILILSRKWCR